MKSKNQPRALRIIGIWATVWWAVTCLWVLEWVLVTQPYYVRQAAWAPHSGFFTNWGSALRSTYSGTASLRLLLHIIIVVWAIGAIKWLLLLKKYHKSYKAAFKDLFLTIRK